MTDKEDDRLICSIQTQRVSQLEILNREAGSLDGPARKALEADMNGYYTLI